MDVGSTDTIIKNYFYCKGYIYCFIYILYGSHTALAEPLVLPDVRVNVNIVAACIIVAKGAWVYASKRMIAINRGGVYVTRDAWGFIVEWFKSIPSDYIQCS